MSEIEAETECIHTWQEAQERLFAGAWQDNLNRYRPSHAFRGLSEPYGELPTSLIRLGKNNEESGFDGSHGQKVESDILRNFLKYAEDRSLSEKSVWHQLSVAQHYGLPTRILDWTYSPLVGLHFATSDMKKLEEKGVIWRVDIDVVHDLLPYGWTSRKDGHVFTIDELNEQVTTYSELKSDFEESGLDTPLFFEPPALDGRIVNQFALFSVLPDPTMTFDEWLLEHPDVFERYEITPSAKMEIRDKLDASNITERVLFPGLDGLADWLKRYYTPIEEGDTLSPSTRDDINGWDSSPEE